MTSLIKELANTFSSFEAGAPGETARLKKVFKANSMQQVFQKALSIIDSVEINDGNIDDIRRIFRTLTALREKELKQTEGNSLLHRRSDVYLFFNKKKQSHLDQIELTRNTIANLIDRLEERIYESSLNEETLNLHKRIFTKEMREAFLGVDKAAYEKKNAEEKAELNRNEVIDFEDHVVYNAVLNHPEFDKEMQELNKQLGSKSLKEQHDIILASFERIQKSKWFIDIRGSKDMGGHEKAHLTLMMILKANISPAFAKMDFMELVDPKDSILTTIKGAFFYLEQKCFALQKNIVKLPPDSKNQKIQTVADAFIRFTRHPENSGASTKLKQVFRMKANEPIDEVLKRAKIFVNQSKLLSSDLDCLIDLKENLLRLKEVEENLPADQSVLNKRSKFKLAFISPNDRKKEILASRKNLDDLIKEVNEKIELINRPYIKNIEQAQKELEENKAVINAQIKSGSYDFSQLNPGFKKLLKSKEFADTIATLKAKIRHKSHLEQLIEISKVIYGYVDEESKEFNDIIERLKVDMAEKLKEGKINAYGIIEEARRQYADTKLKWITPFFSRLEGEDLVPLSYFFILQLDLSYDILKVAPFLDLEKEKENRKEIENSQIFKENPALRGPVLANIESAFEYIKMQAADIKKAQKEAQGSRLNIAKNAAWNVASRVVGVFNSVINTLGFKT